ncbi:hypothetical protein POKO110462_07550 [Pontibacter korlensis]|uniref:DUF4347 domain-containing protein n=1 Tax=Pontibacter korlensis TaxID=400092 RepID=A0A0E3ZBX2_9BACT|nr:hypothetical protein [Pontibacter korlensis]AKD02250.1 hypothetical protein PKOR_02750 [Pontibacter korlensis]
MKTYLVVALLSLTFSAQAQQLNEQKKVTVRLNCAPPTAKSQALVLVNEQEASPNAIILNPNDIESINVLKGSEVPEQLADKGKHGVIMMELKQELPLARLEEVYKAFNISKEEQNLTLAINGTHVKDTSLLLADLRQIEKVEVADFDTSRSQWSFKEQYLNIITKPQH